MAGLPRTLWFGPDHDSPSLAEIGSSTPFPAPPPPSDGPPFLTAGGTAFRRRPPSRRRHTRGVLGPRFDSQPCAQYLRTTRAPGRRDRVAVARHPRRPDPDTPSSYGHGLPCPCSARCPPSVPTDAVSGVVRDRRGGRGRWTQRSRTMRQGASWSGLVQVGQRPGQLGHPTAADSGPPPAAASPARPPWAPAGRSLQPGVARAAAAPRTVPRHPGYAAR